MAVNEAPASHRRWPIGQRDGPPSVALADARASGVGRGVVASMSGVLGDAFLLLLVVWAVPVALLLLGAPVALLLRAFIELVSAL